MKTKVVIGLGAGRCGTKSLAAFLRAYGCAVTHEYGQRLVWLKQLELDYDPLVLDRIQSFFLRESQVVGDVAFYYLPYVERILLICSELNVSVRFVCMKREKAGTVASYMNWLRHRNVNHWVRHDGTEYSLSPWDECFPKYAVDEMGTAIEMYWDDYYRQAGALAKKYADVFRIFDIDVLNNLAGIRSIIDFIGGLEFRRPYTGIHKNLSHGHFYSRKNPDILD